MEVYFISHENFIYKSVIEKEDILEKMIIVDTDGIYFAEKNVDFAKQELEKFFKI